MPKKKKTKHTRKAPAKKIEIIPARGGNPPTVDQPSVTLSKGKKEQVKWWSRSKDWVVVFEGATPFDLHYYGPHNPGNRKITGSVKGYKYSIYVDGASADPMIILTR